MRPLIRGIRSVEIELADPARAAAFYEEVWNLTPVAASDGVSRFRGTGIYHHLLAIHHAAGAPAIRRVVLDGTDRAATDELYQNIGRMTTAIDAPRTLDWPGGGYGFGFKDAEGRNFAVVSEVADYDPEAPEADRPTKVSHVNFNAADIAGTTRFLVDGLGLRVIDTTARLTFFHTDSGDHHAIVAAMANAPTLNHIAFEMPDLASVMRGAGRMRDHGYPIEWGIGRHGPGNNVFAYFAGPEEMPLSTRPRWSRSVVRMFPKGPIIGGSHRAAATGGVSPARQARGSSAFKGSSVSRPMATGWTWHSLQADSDAGQQRGRGRRIARRWLDC